MANIRIASTWASIVVMSSLAVLAGCVTPPPAPPVAVQPPPPRVDDRMDGNWAPLKAELGGRDYRLPAEFRLQVQGNRFKTIGSARPDSGALEFIASEPAGLNVTGEEGPTKDRKLMAIYRFNGMGELEICYDLSGATRPVAFESRAGTQLFRITYRRVP